MICCRRQPDFRRYNGWSLPLNGMQIFSWIIFFLLFIGSTLATLPYPFLPLLPIINIVIHLWIFFWMVFMTSYNPGNGIRTTPAVFDRQRHIHVIEKLYCNICQTKVDEGTKHCRHCNKCIPGFDHHCKWLNNCVGSKNYRYFIILVISLTILSMLLIFSFSTCIGLFAAQGSPEPINSTIIEDWRILNSWSWCLLTVATITCHLIIFGLSAHLLSFHFLLWRKGMTTIAYIIEKRRQKSRNSNSSNATQQSIQSFSSNPLGNAWYRLSSRQGFRTNMQRIQDSSQISVPESGPGVRQNSLPGSPTISIINKSTVQASRGESSRPNSGLSTSNQDNTSSNSGKLPPINRNGSRY